MRICIFGDSITWGASDYEQGGWVERLKTHTLERYDEVHVYNLGVPGNDTDDLLLRFTNEAKVREPDLIMFAIGINDSQYLKNNNQRVDTDRFKSNLSRLLTEAQEITERVVFIGLTDVDETKIMPDHDREGAREYDAIIKSFCEKNDTRYLSMAGVVPVEELADGLHPNSRGHEKMFQAVREGLEEFLEQ